MKLKYVFTLIGIILNVLIYFIYGLILAIWVPIIILLLYVIVIDSNKEINNVNGEIH